MSYGWPTTRRFARSTMQAFQQDQAQWWFPPERTTADKMWLYAAITFFLSTVLFVVGAT